MFRLNIVKMSLLNIDCLKYAEKMERGILVSQCHLIVLFYIMMYNHTKSTNWIKTTTKLYLMHNVSFLFLIQLINTMQ